MSRAGLYLTLCLFVAAFATPRASFGAPPQNPIDLKFAESSLIFKVESLAGAVSDLNVKESPTEVRIELSGTKVIQIAFTYRDRILANKVTQDLVSRFIAESLSYTSAIATESVQFLQDELDKVGKSWLKMSAEVKATKASDPRYELLILARDQKRKEYETVSQKLGAAETLRDLEQRGQGSRLELLDAASMPQEPDTAVPTAELAGLGCGLAVGLLGTLWRALRRTTPPEFSVPRVEPAG